MKDIGMVRYISRGALAVFVALNMFLMTTKSIFGEPPLGTCTNLPRYTYGAGGEIKGEKCRLTKCAETQVWSPMGYEFTRDIYCAWLITGDEGSCICPFGKADARAAKAALARERAAWRPIADSLR